MVKSDGGKLYLNSLSLIFELTKHVRVNDAKFDRNSFLWQSAYLHQTLNEHQAAPYYMELQFLMTLYQIIQYSAFFSLISK